MKKNNTIERYSVSYDGAMKLIKEMRFDFSLEIKMDDKTFILEGDSISKKITHNIDIDLLIDSSISDILECSDSLNITKIKSSCEWTTESIDNYFNESNYGVYVKELWEVKDRKYYAVKDVSPSGDAIIYNIYVKDNSLYNENDDNIIAMAIHCL